MKAYHKIKKGLDTNLILSLMATIVALIVKVLGKQISAVMRSLRT